MFSQAVADTICHQLAEGKSLRAACAEEGMPSAPTILRWAGEDDAFSKQYARARETGYALLADEIIDISDGTGDVARDRLSVDSRKWMLSKMLPKVYGEKIETTHRGGPANVLISETDARL